MYNRAVALGRAKKNAAAKSAYQAYLQAFPEAAWAAAAKKALRSL